MTDVPSVADIKAKLDAFTPEQRETLSFIQWCERHFGSPSTLPSMRLTPHQKAMMDHIMDETRKNPVQVLIYKAPPQSPCPGRYIREWFG